MLDGAQNSWQHFYTLKNWNKNRRQPYLEWKSRDSKMNKFT